MYVYVHGHIHLHVYICVLVSVCMLTLDRSDPTEGILLHASFISWNLWLWNFWILPPLLNNLLTRVSCTDYYFLLLPMSSDRQSSCRNVSSQRCWPCLSVWISQCCPSLTILTALFSLSLSSEKNSWRQSLVLDCYPHITFISASMTEEYESRAPLSLLPWRRNMNDEQDGVLVSATSQDLEEEIMARVTIRTLPGEGICRWQTRVACLDGFHFQNRKFFVSWMVVCIHANDKLSCSQRLCASS